MPDACANIVRNPRRSVARYLGRSELERLGAALDQRQKEHPWPVAAIRLLTLTGARLSEIVNLKWNEIGEFGKDGASARLEDSKTGPRTVWLGPEAASVLAALPRTESEERVFPGNLTSSRLYTFWVGVRDEAGLPGVRIHDCRHTWASQGVMNGVGLTTVGRLLGHRQRETTAIYAHLDDAALYEAAAQVANVMARAMDFNDTAPGLPDDKEKDGEQCDQSLVSSSRAMPADSPTSPKRRVNAGLPARKAKTSTKNIFHEGTSTRCERVQPEPNPLRQPRPTSSVSPRSIGCDGSHRLAAPLIVCRKAVAMIDATSVCGAERRVRCGRPSPRMPPPVLPSPCPPKPVSSQAR